MYLSSFLLFFCLIVIEMTQGIISTGMAYEAPSFVSNLVVFCFEECQIDCLFTIQLKLYMIKTANQEFITFNEPLIYFYLIDVNFFVYVFPLAKRRSKLNMEETFLEDIEDIDFLILNQNELFIEEENPSEELVISEEEIAALDTSAMKETNVEDLPKLIFIDEKSGNMRVVVMKVEVRKEQKAILSQESWLPIDVHFVVNVTSVSYSTKSMSSIVK